MKVYNVSDVAKELKISINKAYELLNTGQIKYFKIGQRRKVSEHALDEFIVIREKECLENQSAS